mgnify:FL=1
MGPHGPEQAVRTRYFTGEEQDRLDRQLTSLGSERDGARAALAQKGLEQLKAFDRTQLSASQLVSAALLEWQLQTAIAQNRYRDYMFPFPRACCFRSTAALLLFMENQPLAYSDERFRDRGGQLSERQHHLQRAFQPQVDDMNPIRPRRCGEC